jgi:hypothetical protein
MVNIKQINMDKEAMSMLGAMSQARKLVNAALKDFEAGGNPEFIKDYELPDQQKVRVGCKQKTQGVEVWVIPTPFRALTAAIKAKSQRKPTGSPE